MILTFPERRRQMNQQTDLALLKAEYPSLFDYNQVNADLNENNYITSN